MTGGSDGMECFFRREPARVQSNTANVHFRPSRFGLRGFGLYLIGRIRPLNFTVFSERNVVRVWPMRQGWFSLLEKFR
jgi:hypothetical protein